MTDHVDAVAAELVARYDDRYGETLAEYARGINFWEGWVVAGATVTLTAAELAEAIAKAAANRGIDDPPCPRCVPGQPGPPHDNRNGHRPHCSCDGCY